MLLKVMLPVVLLAIATSATNSNDLPEFGPSDLAAQHENVVRMLLNTFKSRSGKGVVGVAPADLTDEEIAQCFDHYFELERQISEQYNSEYRSCIMTAAEEKKEVSEQSEALREELIQRGDTVCSDISTCNANDDILEFLSCISKSANSNINTLFNLSNDADNESIEITAKYQKIERDRNTCINACQINYKNNMVYCNNQLDKCLAGETDPLPTTTTPSPTTTEEDTTPEETTPEETTPEETTPEETTTEEDDTTSVTEETTTEPMPEEDLRVGKPMPRMSVWNILKRF